MAPHENEWPLAEPDWSIPLVEGPRPPLFPRAIVLLLLSLEGLGGGGEGLPFQIPAAQTPSAPPRERPSSDDALESRIEQQISYE